MNVLIVVPDRRPAALRRFADYLAHPVDAHQDAAQLLGPIPGIRSYRPIPPLPLFNTDALRALDLDAESKKLAGPFTLDLPSERSAIAVDMDEGAVLSLLKSRELDIWLDPPMMIPRQYNVVGASEIHCGNRDVTATVTAIRQKMHVDSAWSQGFQGEGIVAAIIDKGVMGGAGGYKVTGVYPLPAALPLTPVNVRAHGCLVAAGLAVAAPKASVYDFRIPGAFLSSDVQACLASALSVRARSGPPHLLVCSAAFIRVPSSSSGTAHPALDLSHPLNLAYNDLVLSGCTVALPSGNCCPDCPSAECEDSVTTAPKPIFGPNSLESVITVAALNGIDLRPEYSSTGPGVFTNAKPDVCAYTQIYGDWGFELPQRQQGWHDKGTSYAAPVAAGVAALLLNKHPGLTPAEVKDLLVRGVREILPTGFDFATGFGAVDVAGSLALMH